MLGRFFIWMIRGYQRWISRWFPPVCRYYPSCSQYAVEALQKKRFLTAVFLICWRLVRCNPLSRGGYDPVP